MDFKGIHTALTQETKRYYLASRKVVDATRKFKEMKSQLVSQGVEGKNAAEREANLGIALRDTAHELQSAEDKLAEARHQLDLATIDYDIAKLELRYLELGNFGL